MTTQTIRELNDQFRQSFSENVWFTRGIMELPERHIKAISKKVRNFRAFNEGNDPYGEHDFGAFTHRGRKIFWKIDYYDVTDPEGQRGSADPADPEKTYRTLTVMLAEDY